MRFITFLLLLVLILIYAVIGGLIFRAIESSNQDALVQNVNKTIQTVLDANPCLNYTSVVELQGIIIQMNNNGVRIPANNLIQANAVFSTRFDVLSSILFTSSIFSGFGVRNSLPQTTGGKVFNSFYNLFCGFYSFIVLLHLIFLINLVFDALYIRIKIKYNRNLNIISKKAIQYSIWLGSGFILFIIIPAAIFMALEKWSYGDSLYFGLTVTYSIGFGDFITGFNYNTGISDLSLSFYRACSGFWIILNQTWFAVILYQINSIVINFLWTNTEDIVDEGIEDFDESVKKTRDKVETLKRRIDIFPKYDSSGSLKKLDNEERPYFQTGYPYMMPYGRPQSTVVPYYGMPSSYNNSNVFPVSSSSVQTGAVTVIKI